MSNPWYPWYSGDYRRDTPNLTQGQHGAYRLLLDYYYSTGKPLPCLEQCLRIACSFTKEERAATKFVLESFFTLQTDGTWKNKRADTVIEEQGKKRANAKEKAEKAARARWGKDAPSMPEALPEEVPEQCQPEPEPDPKIDLDLKEPKTLCDNPADDHYQNISDDALDLGSMLANLILKNNPANRALKGQKYHTTYTRWAKDIDKLIRIDKFSRDQISDVIEWCQNDSFWKSNILSGAKLRKQFDQLVLKMNNEKKGSNNGSSGDEWNGGYEPLN